MNRVNTIMIKTCLLYISLVSVCYANSVTASNGQSWNFRVYLDNKEIGQHSFQVTQNNNVTHVEIVASFEVSFLFFKAYSYQHSNYEVWSGECLHSISSRTDDNGKQYFVEGYIRDTVLFMHTVDGPNELDGCIKTFAYWDPDFLESESLLNSQTGEMVEVEVTDLGPDIIDISGKPVTGNRYRLESHDFSIDLWYSVNDRKWLAMESVTSTGSKLRYQAI